MTVKYFIDYTFRYAGAFDLPDEVEAPEGFVEVPFPPGDASDVWSDELGAWVPDLAVVKRRRKKEVTALFSAKLADGFGYSGRQIALDTASAKGLADLGVAATEVLRTAGTWPVGTKWRAIDGSYLDLDTAADAAALAAAAVLAGQALLQASWAHRDAIDTLATYAEVVAYDVAAGW